MRNYTPYFDDSDNGLNYNEGRTKPQTTNTTYYKSTDLYGTTADAEARSYNIGCTGYRNVIINSSGQINFAPCVAAQTYTLLMRGMPKQNVNRRYYSFDQRDNIFDVRDSINDNTYEGYDYKYTIFEKTLSNNILKDPVKDGILLYFQRVVFGLIETTKQIKNFVNYTVKKNNRRVF